MKNHIDLKEDFPFHIRIAILITLVVFILAFQFVPKTQTKPYKPKRMHAIKVEKLPPQLKNIVEPPPPPKPKLPVAAAKDEKVEAATIQKTDFTGVEREAKVDLNVPDFVPYEIAPKVLNLVQIEKSIEYPDIAKKAGIEGTVYLKVLVWTDGTVKRVKIIKSLYDALDNAAVKAAYHLRFKPALQRDKPVAVWVAIPFKFSLTE